MWVLDYDPPWLGVSCGGLFKISPIWAAWEIKFLSQALKIWTEACITRQTAHGLVSLLVEGRYANDTLIGSISNDDCDGNKSGKKAIGLDFRQNNNFTLSSCYFVHFFAITARLQHETFLISHFMEDENARQGVSFFFFFCELKYIPLEFDFWINWQHLTN